ncbi:MAG: hypothetical protein Q8R28_09640, partial [Dehalococcoidia bacterium]|nr:hypothetical protein [Dehalococcoidia bacterium]
KRPLKVFFRELFDQETGGFEKIYETGKEVVDVIIDPFAGEQILFGAIMDTWPGRGAKDRPPLYHANDTELRKFGLSLWHVFDKALTPGVVGDMVKMYKGADKQVRSDGKEFDLMNEILGQVSGINSRTLNFSEAFASKARQENSLVTQAATGISMDFKSRGTKSENELRENVRRNNDNMRESMATLRTKYLAALKMGASKSSLRQSMDGSGLSDAKIAQIMDNFYTPYMPQPTSLNEMRERGEALGQDRVGIFRDETSKIPVGQPLTVREEGEE